MSRAGEWLSSAESNFKRIRGRVSRSNPCGLIEHYTDVIAEATVASAMAGDDRQIGDRAEKLTRTATRAQRGAVKACQLSVKPKARR